MKIIEDDLTLWTLWEGAAFEPALRLYRKYGFKNGDVLANYVASDFNQFLHLNL